MTDARMVATNTHRRSRAVQSAVPRADRIACSSHGRALGLINRLPSPVQVHAACEQRRSGESEMPAEHGKAPPACVRIFYLRTDYPNFRPIGISGRLLSS